MKEPRQIDHANSGNSLARSSSPPAPIARKDKVDVLAEKRGQLQGGGSVTFGRIADDFIEMREAGWR